MATQARVRARAPAAAPPPAQAPLPAPPPPPATAAEALCVFAKDSVFRNGPEGVEIEFRLGRRVGANFEAGVPEQAWLAIKERLDASQFAQSYKETRELQDDTGKYVADVSGAEQPYWMHKTKLHAVDLDTGSAWVVRAAIALEAVERPAMEPHAPTFSRHKKRWKYAHECWTFDLTRVRSNCPDQLDSDTDIFEVEVELADTSVLFRRPLDNVLQWGWQLIGDCFDMSGLRNN